VSVTDGAVSQDAGADGYSPPFDALFPIPDATLDTSVLGCPSIVAIEPISAATPCTYSMPVPDAAAVNPQQVNLIYLVGDDSQYVVVASSATTCDSGWHFINDQTEIEICGSTCDVIRNDPGAQIALWLPCVDPPLPS
jgi:hypothetical protein